VISEDEETRDEQADERELENRFHGRRATNRKIE